MNGQLGRRTDRRAHEGSIDTLGAQAFNQFGGAALFKAQRDQRMCLAECPDHARHKRMERGRAGEAEPDPPGFAARGAARRGGSVLDPVEDPPRLGEERFACLGQLDPARLAPEQLHLELGFESPDLLTERRLLDA